MLITIQSSGAQPSIDTGSTRSAEQSNAGQRNTAQRNTAQSNTERTLMVGLLIGLLLGSEKQEGSQLSSSPDGRGAGDLGSFGGSNGFTGAHDAGDSDLLDQLLKSFSTQQQQGIDNPSQQTNNLLGDISDNSLDGVSNGSTDDRTGEVKLLLELLAQLMDSNSQQFPSDDGNSGQGDSGGSALTPSGGSAGPVGSGGGVKGGANPAPTTPVSSPKGSSTTPPGVGPSTTAGGVSGSSNNTGSDNIPGTTVSGNTVIVHKPIEVGAGQTFDGHGKTFVAGPELGDGGQGENQKELFRLAEGSTLKNVNIDKDGADGIHIVAANSDPVTLDNVNSKDVGEDFLTVKGDGGAAKTDVNVVGGSAANASDKIFQVNAAANIDIQGFKANDFGTFLRTNGGKDIPMDLTLSDVSASEGHFNFIKSDTSTDLHIHTHDVQLQDVPNTLNVPKGALVEQS